MIFENIIVSTFEQVVTVLLF